MKPDQPTPAEVNEECRRRFESAWVEGTPLEIASCTPPVDDPTFLATLEELVHIDIEFGWKRWSSQRGADEADRGKPARPRPVEYYVNAFEQLKAPEVMWRIVEQEYLVRNRHGDQPYKEDYQRRFPELWQAGGDLETIGSVGQTDMLGSPDTTIINVSDRSKERTTAPRLGNYELLNEIGRGGMGVVYRARQISADRIVALKVIRDDGPKTRSKKVDAKLVERFRTEAQAAAKLEHDNIVAVYEVGEEDGQHYFSMRHVVGQSLDELLKHGPLTCQRAASYIEQAARGVQEAHEHQILHRDVKPQNILIDAKTDRAMVADFGLAKVRERENALTREGDVMGTPAYMPPEQVRSSHHVNQRADVYSLGATLYHVVTGRPPFQAATFAGTLRQVLDVEPVSPAQLNRDIDRDLETICLKCLRKEPAQRYGTARELADDLARYQDGQPIRARRIGVAGRAVRWCRRNRLLSGALAAAVFFLLAALTAATAGYINTSAALRDEQLALDRAEKSDQRSREVVNQFFTVVSEETLLNQPGMYPLREELLRLAEEHYERFLAEHEDDPKLMQEVARTQYRLGLVGEATEPSPTKALARMARAREIQDRLPREGRANADIADELGDTLNVTGRLQLALGEPDLALASLEASKAVREELVTQNPDHRDYRRKLANTLMNIGLVHKQRQRTAVALQALDDAQAAREKLLGDLNATDLTPGNLRIYRDAAMGYFNRGNLHATQREFDLAKKDLIKAIESFETVCNERSNDLKSRSRLGSAQLVLGELKFRTKDNAGAQRDLATARTTLQALAAGSPTVLEFQDQLAAALVREGNVALVREAVPAARVAFQEAVATLKRIVPEPDSRDQRERRRNYATALRQLARADIKSDDRDTAIDHLKLAREYLAALTRQSPSDEQAKQDLSETERLLLMIDAH